MIKNIFLDAGGIILDEEMFENISANIITDILKCFNENYSIAHYWRDAEEAVYRYVPKVYDYILYKNIVNKSGFNEVKKRYKDRLKQENNRFYLADGIKDFLVKYSKDYNIGILGQYGNDFREYLKEENILQYFAYRETQDDYKITKPDPRYFEAILKRCNCKAEESIMIGDRIDKDVIPAKLTGMKTVRVKVGLHKTQEPRIPEEIPDVTVENLGEITMEMVKALDWGV
ncbi:MAG: HAD family hydrolase [Spirochaetaceae bacterium]|jgi:8-oxo-dGTP diphosphatase/putative hydrolase of the HAD superfamily|nr:HAD family hydrolase [Spirochaetaceae bacterium]